MAGEPLTRCHMRWCVVVAAGEITSAWRHVVSLSEPGFLPRVDRGMAHPMVGSSAGVEVVVGKFR